MTHVRPVSTATPAARQRSRAIGTRLSRTPSSLAYAPSSTRTGPGDRPTASSLSRALGSMLPVTSVWVAPAASSAAIRARTPGSTTPSARTWWTRARSATSMAASSAGRRSAACPSRARASRPIWRSVLPAMCGSSSWSTEVPNTALIASANASRPAGPARSRVPSTSQRTRVTATRAGGVSHEAVGDRQAAVLAERLHRDPHARGCLAPLPLGHVDEAHDPLDQPAVHPRREQLLERHVLLDVRGQEGVEDVVGRQALVVALPGAQLGRGRFRQHAVGDDRADRVAVAGELVHARLEHVLDHGEPAGHVHAVDRRVPHRQLALVAADQHQPAELVVEGHEDRGAQPPLEIFLGDALR